MGGSNGELLPPTLAVAGCAGSCLCDSTHKVALRLVQRCMPCTLLHTCAGPSCKRREPLAPRDAGHPPASANLGGGRAAPIPVPQLGAHMGKHC